jgi:thymidylate synthase (FAD)
MKIIDPSAEIINPKGDMCAEELIETVARTCYKSEDKITPGSAKRFVKGLIKRGHTAMLEHATFIFQMSNAFFKDFFEELGETNQPDLYLKYFAVSFSPTGKTNQNIVSTNARVLVGLYKEVYSLDVMTVNTIYPNINVLFKALWDYYGPNELFSYTEAFFYPDNINFDVKVLSREKLLGKGREDYELMKHITHTIKFVCDRGVSHELVRHRPCSFAQESTRYCNYTQGKFGSELTFIKPCFFKHENEFAAWSDICEQLEGIYTSMINLGYSPQEARSILPNCLKTEIIITANEEEWEHILNLRLRGTTGKPHPQMVEVMEKAYPLLKEASQGRIE